MSQPSFFEKFFRKRPPLDRKFIYKHEDFTNKIELTYGDIKGKRNFKALPKSLSREFEIYQKDWVKFYDKCKFDVLDHQNFMASLSDKYKYRIL